MKAVKYLTIYRAVPGSTLRLHGVCHFRSQYAPVMRGTVTGHQRPRIGKRMVLRPGTGVYVVLRLLKKRVCNSKSMPLQRVAQVGLWFLILATKAGVSG